MADAHEPEGGTESGTDPSLTTVELDTALARQATPRKRLLQATVIVVPLLALGALAVHTALPLLRPQAPAQTKPTLVGSLAPNLPVTVTSNVSFGTLTVNNQQVKGALPRQLTLQPGLNMLTLVAPPFGTQTCLVQGPIIMADPSSTAYNPVVVPPGQDSPCHFQAVQTADGSVTAYLAFELTGAALPADQQAQARQAVDAALSSMAPQRGTVPVGQSYATGVDAHGLPTSRRATQPLSAALSYSLFLPDSTAIHGDGGLPCASGLCAVGDQGDYWSSRAAAPAWIVDVATTAHWRFTSPAGSTLGSVTYADSGQATVVLTYDQQAGWHLASSALTAASGTAQVALMPDTCQAGVQLTQQLLAQSSVSGMDAQPAATTGENQLPACVIEPTEQNGAPIAHFIWRFGVLSAADDQAHALAPSLPVATQDEIKAVNVNG